MAFQIQKISPLDLQPRKAVGVSIPFSAKAVFNSTYTTQDALRSNIVNFFLTDSGERFLNPNFGAGLRSVVFEQITSDKIDEIDSLVRTGMSTWFPNVVVNNVQIQESADLNLVTVFITYSVPYTNIQQDRVVINFQQ
jgi:phage baseplate assembly protein W